MVSTRRSAQESVPLTLHPTTSQATRPKAHCPFPKWQTVVGNSRMAIAQHYTQFFAYDHSIILGPAMNKVMTRTGCHSAGAFRSREANSVKDATVEEFKRLYPHLVDGGARLKNRIPPTNFLEDVDTALGELVKKVHTEGVRKATSQARTAENTYTARPSTTSRLTSSSTPSSTAAPAPALIFSTSSATRPSSSSPISATDVDLLLSFANSPFVSSFDTSIDNSAAALANSSVTNIDTSPHWQSSLAETFGEQSCISWQPTQVSDYHTAPFPSETWRATPQQSTVFQDPKMSSIVFMFNGEDVDLLVSCLTMAWHLNEAGVRQLSDYFARQCDLQPSTPGVMKNISFDKESAATVHAILHSLYYNNYNFDFDITDQSKPIVALEDRAGAHLDIYIASKTYGMPGLQRIAFSTLLDYISTMKPQEHMASFLRKCYGSANPPRKLREAIAKHCVQYLTKYSDDDDFLEAYIQFHATFGIDILLATADQKRAESRSRRALTSL